HDTRHAFSCDVIWEMLSEDVIVSKVAILVEFLQFLKHRKKWWLIPIVVLLVLLGALLVLSEGSVLAPFIYTLF
ncbi:MAG: DUF5989 family protein, partial [Planctomycetota bacterium]